MSSLTVWVISFATVLCFIKIGDAKNVPEKELTLHWGIVSASKIGNDFVNAMRSALPKEHHVVEAVAASSLERAQKFANEHEIPKAYQGYDKLAEDPNINIAYISNLNPQHYEVVKMMLEHGKHVLCEKPMTMNEKQTTKLIKLAEDKNLFLMEAVWSRFFPVYSELRKLIDSKAIGEVQYVNIAFGLDLSGVERLHKKSLGGGAILDLGVYTLQFQQFMFRGQDPLNFTAIGHLNAEGTDDTSSCVITYPGGKIVSLTVSSKIPLPNEAIVVGTKGTIRVPHFWTPTQLVTQNKTLNFALPVSNLSYNFGNYSIGLSYEAEAVRQCLMENKIESEVVPHSESVQLAKLMDAWRKNVGVIFPEDNE